MAGLAHAVKPSKVFQYSPIKGKSSLTQLQSGTQELWCHNEPWFKLWLQSQPPTVIYLADNPELVCFQQISSHGMYQEASDSQGEHEMYLICWYNDWIGEVMSVLIRRSKDGCMSIPTEILTLQTRATRDSTPLSMVLPSRDASRKKK